MLSNKFCALKEEVTIRVERQLVVVITGMMLLPTIAGISKGSSVYIPNASFELPKTAFVDVNVDSWQKSPTPQWYDESALGPWIQLTGVFMNIPATEPDHIDNCDGNQAAWLFAVPEVELYQDLATTFEIGQCYCLTVGVLGGGGNMKDDVPLEIRLYYRDTNDVRVTVGATTFIYHTDDGYIKHFNDVGLFLPAVSETDPWAGKNIGVQIISTLTLADLDPETGRAGGYWDVDNVRLTQLPLVQALPVYIPNASFELPETAFVDVNVDSWQNSPTPAWYDESGGYVWSQLTGVFQNVPPEDEAHIDNCDGNQAAWLFAVPEVELYQDLAATFEVGQCYCLTVGVLGGGGNMKDDVPLEIRLYYRDANDVRVTIGATTFTYHTEDGYVKHFKDVGLFLPVVHETDPWAGRNIGAQIISTLTLTDLDPETGRAGGYWDVDNVRLTQSPPWEDSATME